LRRYDDVRVAALNPLDHFIAFALTQRRDPIPLFDTVWYLAQNPAVAASGENPLAHYLREGAAAGRDPNPLFDTAWYRAQNPAVAASGENPLAHYLREGAAAGRDPNPLFDTVWYRAQNPAVAASGENPLAHYLREGAAAGRDPHPLFDARWYRDQYTDVPRNGYQSAAADYLRQGGRDLRIPHPLLDVLAYVPAHPDIGDPAEAPRHFWEGGRDVDTGAYRSPKDLRARQARYLARTETHVCRDARPQARRFAVLFQCGSGSVHARWFGGGPRTWDLVVNHYDQTYRGAIPCEVELHQTGELPGTKFTAVHALLERHPDVLGRYAYVLLLDDDVVMEMADVDRLFALSEAHGLDQAQASLSADSFGTYDVFRNAGLGLRTVRGVEIMMPVLSRRALEAARPLFGESVSGWGIDYALAELMAAVPGSRAVVVDDVIAHHTKPIDPTGGAYYRMLAREEIYPRVEMHWLMRRYGVRWHDFSLS
jgi:hypothetical protein